MRKTVIAVALCGLLAVGSAAQAQPGTGPGSGAPDWRAMQDMTPEERVKAMAKMREDAMRTALSSASVVDKAIQDSVIAFHNERETARRDIREKAAATLKALESAALIEPDAAIVKAFRDALVAEKARQTKALAALDKKIEYSKKPQLELALMALGIIGDDTSFLTPGGPMRGGRGGRGGGGGFGGGQ